MKLPFILNGVPVEWEIDPSDILLDVLREQGYEGAKRGCDDGSCGACAVIIDGHLYNSCLLFAAQVHQREVTTIEGLGTTRQPHPLQAAFVEHGAVQCGYCTPGMLLAAKQLLDQTPSPTEEEVKEALDGNLCRCTGYVKPIEAVLAAAKRIRDEGGTS